MGKMARRMWMTALVSPRNKNGHALRRVPGAPGGLGRGVRRAVPELEECEDGLWRGRRREGR